MSKFLVETNYTCTFKIIHELDEINEKALSDIDSRKDGKVEIIDVTVNNRKTKKANSSDKKIKKFDLKDDIKINHKSNPHEKDKIKSKIINELTSLQMMSTKQRKFLRRIKWIVTNYH